MKAYETRFREGLPSLVVQNEYVTDSLYIKVLAHLPYSTIPFQTFCSQQIGDRQIMPKAVVRSEH